MCELGLHEVFGDNPQFKVLLALFYKTDFIDISDNSQLIHLGKY